MGSEKEVIVTYAADENVVTGLYVSIYTLINNLNIRDIYKIIVIDGGIDRDSKRKLKYLCDGKDNVTLEYRRAPIHMIKDLDTPHNFGRSVYLLLLIPKVISRNEKIVYLDTDTVVREDIGLLYKKNVKNTTCLAVRDYLSYNMEAAFKVTCLPQVISCDPKDPYFNSGVLVINSKRWSNKNITERSINMLSKYSDKLRVADQDALNGVLHNDWRELNFKWNVQLNYLMDRYHSNPEYKKPNTKQIKGLKGLDQISNRSGILHFNNHPKPWSQRYTGPYRDNYRSIIYESPFTNKGKVAKSIDKICKLFFITSNFLLRDIYYKRVKPIIINYLKHFIM